MQSLDKSILDRVALQVPEILLPGSQVDLQKWAVVACDQFTSEPEYWTEVEKITRGVPSSYHVIFPEVFLEGPGKEERIQRINQTMQEYIQQDILKPCCHGFILVRRKMANGLVRTGLMVSLDLDKYDFHAGSHAMIRATEKTVMERIPPRVQIRKDAPVELPHVLVLIDDPEKKVIEPLIRHFENPACMAYETDLMLHGGSIKGYQITDSEKIQEIALALETLIKPDGYLYAVGDGNHSLATAKQCWDNLKKSLSEEDQKRHPARYALVELNNIHDEGMVFEPIHRVLFNIDPDKLKAYLQGDGPEVVLVQGSYTEHIRLKQRPGNLAVGVLQTLLDEFMALYPDSKIDFIHGEKSLRKLSDGRDKLGFLLSAMKKSDLFKTVSLDGALPRKTFSMGEAEEKRYYFEARKIR